jgi:hypothetical protein
VRLILVVGSSNQVKISSLCNFALSSCTTIIIQRHSKVAGPQIIHPISMFGAPITFGFSHCFKLAWPLISVDPFPLFHHLQTKMLSHHVFFLSHSFLCNGWGIILTPIAFHYLQLSKALTWTIVMMSYVPKMPLFYGSQQSWQILLHRWTRILTSQTFNIHLIHISPPQ